MRGVKASFETLKGLPLARWKLVQSMEDLSAFGFPVFLKIDSAGHKTDRGGVVRCDDLDDACDKLKKMHKTFSDKGIIVQEAADGLEMIVGVKRDEVFGKILVVGFGGVFAEVNKDVSFRALPVSRADVVEMVGELRGKKVFGARGKNHDLEKFYTLVEKVAWLADKKGVVEMDLNPVMLGEDKSLIVDARIELE